MRIVLLGAPGSGKGTQSKLLVDKYKIPQISTGDLLRAAVSAGSELGKRVKPLMESGQFVPDELVLDIIQERLGHADAKNGFILDGFPRTIPQAQALDSMLARVGRPLQLAILVDVQTESLLKRLTGRVTCASCGQMFNTNSQPPKVPGRCDKCNGTLTERADDKEAAVRKRLEDYEHKTSPLIAYYRSQNKLRKVAGEGDVQAILKTITDIIENHINPLSALRPALTQQSPSKPKIAPAKVPPKPTADKMAPKTPSPKPAVAPKAVAKKKAVAKTANKKAVPKAAVKKAVAKKKAAVKKVAVKKKASAVTKKAVLKKGAPKKKAVVKKVAPQKKAAAKKVAPKKKAAVKASVKKTVTKKVAPKKKQGKGRR